MVLRLASRSLSFHSRTTWRRLSGTTPSGTAKPYYITTPIFYPNSVPHIGHLYSLVVADIFARYNSLRYPNNEAHFVTGTDEHGWKIQKAAEQKGLEPLAFCDQLSVHFRDLVQKANASVTRFTRTTESEHCHAVEHLWRQLDTKGLIYKGSYDGWYSISDECFYTNSQITAVPATADSAVANGSLPATEYVATETQNRVERIVEDNYMFRLSQFREPLLAHYKANPTIVYPSQQYEDVLEMLSSPLNDLSISRPSERLRWGIPVPDDPAQTIYVWIDALTTYMSSVGYPWTTSGDAGLSQGWPPNMQVIGKDILRFHAIYLPAMLMALNIPMAQRLLSHAHWTVEHRKMSKSLGNVVDPIQAIDTYGIDIVRYYLALVGGRFKGDVSWDPVQLAKVAKEMPNVLGNLFLRATSESIQSRARDGGNSTDFSTLDYGVGDAAEGLILKVRALKETMKTNMEDTLVVADALEQIFVVLREANVVFTQSAPWKKTASPEEVHDISVLTLETLRVCGILLQPFMPTKSSQLLDALGVPPDQRTLDDAEYSIGRVHLDDVVSGFKLF